MSRRIMDRRYEEDRIPQSASLVVPRKGTLIQLLVCTKAAYEVTSIGVVTVFPDVGAIGQKIHAYTLKDRYAGALLTRDYGIFWGARYV